MVAGRLAGVDPLSKLARGFCARAGKFREINKKPIVSKRVALGWTVMSMTSAGAGSGHRA
jgi:hypothetical protein